MIRTLASVVMAHVVSFSITDNPKDSKTVTVHIEYSDETEKQIVIEKDKLDTPESIKFIMLQTKPKAPTTP